MLKKVQEFIQTKRLVLALGLAGAFAFLGGVYVSAQTEISHEPVVAENINQTDEEVTPEINTPVVTLVEEETPITEEPDVTPTVVTEVTEENADSVTLEEAQAIAVAEHEGVVSKSETKLYNEEAVYKFYFTDGWKVYVSVSDGDIVRVIQASNVTHEMRQKHGKDNDRAVEAQARKSTEVRRDSTYGWGRHDN